MAKKSTGGTPAIDALTRLRAVFTLHEYEHDPTVHNFGEESVAALGLPAERVFKTLVADAVVSGRDQLVVGVVPVTGHLDLKALAAAVGAKKAAMAAPARAEKATGYVVGGISPLGQKTKLPTFIDESARGQETIFVSAGRRGAQVELNPDDLLALLDASYAAIARP